MFKICVPDSRSWKNLMGAVSTLVEEADFDVTAEGVKLRAMDPSHVAVVDFEYPRAAFQEYECSEPAKLCIDVGDLLKLMRRVEPGETLELSLDQQANRLMTKLVGKYTRRFSLPLLQPSSTEVPIPKIEFDVKVKMDAGCLTDAVVDVSTVSEQVRFEADSEKLMLSGLGESGNVVVEFEKINSALLDFQVKGEAKALYELNFLQGMVKAGAASSQVSTLEFSTDKPAKIDFELPSEGKLTYYLAPRAE